jgi:hypothetical protein
MILSAVVAVLVVESKRQKRRIREQRQGEGAMTMKHL